LDGLPGRLYSWQALCEKTVQLSHAGRRPHPFWRSSMFGFLGLGPQEIILLLLIGIPLFAVPVVVLFIIFLANKKKDEPTNE
jgi:urea transporter